MSKLNIRTEQVIDVHDWNSFVVEAYGRPYHFQQQDGCKGRGSFHLRVPDKAEDFEAESIPEEVNHDEMGVNFAAWLARDPKQKLSSPDDYRLRLDLWWERNFYPNIQMIANDLHAKGKLAAGDYMIDIDW